jgi:outer membrane protein TolC
MRKTLAILLMMSTSLVPTLAQRVLTLDSCRALALRNNKQLQAARVKQDVAANTRKAARTNFLPKVDAIGGYELMSKEISLLNDDQKQALSNLGTIVTTNLGNSLPGMLTNMAQQGLITPQQAQAFGQVAQAQMPTVAQSLNAAGNDIRHAFRTNNRNMFGAAVMLRQPIYMGGAITAGNRMAEINEELTAHATANAEQNTLYSVDETYWLVVSLEQKNRLADNFVNLLHKLDADVQKMINEGVATRADGLKVAVKVNEAEMQQTQAADGLALAKMLLCQQCGLPIESDIKVEENHELANLTASVAPVPDGEIDLSAREELKMLQNAIEISTQATKMARAAALPQLALTGGYMLTNPNVYNGYANKFGGVWNVGVLLRVPVWNWQETAYKVRASKALTHIASLELEEARELMELQVNQNRFKVKEADKKYAIALKNVEKADENLRCANLGFNEGVLTATEVMEAQTAWLQAQTQRIDAEIDRHLSRSALNKSLGIKL